MRTVALMLAPSKAMQPLAKGEKALVLVLVALQ